MILLPVELLPWYNCPIAGREIIMKLAFIDTAFRIKRSFHSPRAKLFNAYVYVRVRE